MWTLNIYEMHTLHSGDDTRRLCSFENRFWIFKWAQVNDRTPCRLQTLQCIVYTVYRIYGTLMLKYKKLRTWNWTKTNRIAFHWVAISMNCFSSHHSGCTCTCWWIAFAPQATSTCDNVTWMYWILMLMAAHSILRLHQITSNTRFLHATLQGVCCFCQMLHTRYWFTDSRT